MLSEAVANKLLAGEALAARAPATLPGHNAWVSVYACKCDPDTGMTYNAVDDRPWSYHIRCFERSDYDYETFEFDYSACVMRADTVTHSLAETEAELRKWLPDPGSLDEPWRCDLPI